MKFHQYVLDNCLLPCSDDLICPCGLSSRIRELESEKNEYQSSLGEKEEDIDVLKKKVQSLVSVSFDDSAVVIF